MTTTAAENLTAIVKTYDVRGLVGSQLTEELVTALGAGFAVGRRPVEQSLLRAK